MPTIHSKKNNASEKKRNFFKNQCKALLNQGFSVSKISKKLGESYAHTKNICEQIKSENETI